MCSYDVVSTPLHDAVKDPNLIPTHLPFVNMVHLLYEEGHVMPRDHDYVT